MREFACERSRLFAVLTHGAFVVLVLALAACGGGSERSSLLRSRDHGDITISPNSVTLKQAGQRAGTSATVRLDSRDLPDGDAVSGYAISFSETEADIDISTGPCPAGTGTASCREWTLSAGPRAVPGTHLLHIHSVGAGTMMLFGSLVVHVLPDPDLTDRASLLDRAAPTDSGESHTLLLMADGSLAATGTNRRGEVGAGHHSCIERGGGPTNPGPTCWESPEMTPYVVPLPIAGLWRGLAASAGRSLALRDDGSVWGWGVAVLPAQNRLTPSRLLGFGPGERKAAMVSPNLVLDEEGQVWAVRTEYSATGIDLVRRLHGESDDREEPPPILTDVVAVAGLDLALTNLGQLWTVDAGSTYGGRATTRPINGQPAPARLPDPTVDGRGRQSGASTWAARYAGADAVRRKDGYLRAMVAQDGSLWTWRGTTATEVLDASRMALPVPARQVALDSHSGWALLADGSVWRWTLDDPAAGARVPGITQAVAVTRGAALVAECPGGGSLWDTRGSVAQRIGLVGLGRCIEALVEFTLDVTDTDTEVAVQHYGVCRGRCTYVVVRGMRLRLTPASRRVVGYEAAGLDAAGTCLQVPGADLRRDFFAGPKELDLPVGEGLSCSLALNHDQPLLAEGNYRIELRRVGDGRVTTSPPGLDCGSTCEFAFKSQRGEVVHWLNLQPGPGQQIERIEGDPICRTGRLAMQPSGRGEVQRLRCTVVFSPIGTTSPELAAEVTGQGRVEAADAGIDCPGRCSAMQAPGSSVTLNATPAPGWSLDGWTGDCSGSATSASVTMARSSTCVAHFVRGLPLETRFSLNVEGRGRVTGTDIDCPGDCEARVPRTPTTSITLTATPAAGQRFVGWSGMCSGSEPVVSLLMDGPRECTARFVAVVVPTSTLSLTVSGQGGVSFPAAGLFCRDDCSASLPTGSNVTLTAIPEPGWRVSWSGPPACNSSGASLVLDLTADLSCRAEFSRVQVLPSGWTNVTSPYLGSRQRGRPAIAFNAAGEPTVAFALADAQERGALQVLRLRGGLWAPVGTEVNAGQPSVSGAPALVLRDNGEPVVAWADGPGAIRVASWDGSAWVPLGGNLTVGGNAAPASAPQLEIHGTQLVLSFSEWQGGTARAVLLRSDAGGPWVGGYLPNVGAAGGLLTRLALDAQGAATLLVLGQTALGGELPMRVYEETSAGWQPVCNVVPVRGVTANASYANASVGFGVQRHRERDGRAIVIGTSVDYRQILAWQCDNGIWVSAAASASGAILEVDNNTRSLLDAVLIPWRNGTGPELLVAISNGYDGSTELVHQYMGFTVFQSAPSLSLPRRAQGGSMAAGNIGGGALGIVQGYERGAALELEVWRYGP